MRVNRISLRVEIHQVPFAALGKRSTIRMSSPLNPLRVEDNPALRNEFTSLFVPGVQNAATSLSKIIELRYERVLFHPSGREVNWQSGKALPESGAKNAEANGNIGGH